MKLSYRTMFYPLGVIGISLDIDSRILECVDSALGKLGENVRQSIYYYLKKDFMLEKFEIPRKPEVFERALISIFGKEGCKVIEKMILVEIRKNFRLKRVLSFKKAIKVLSDAGTCSKKQLLNK